MDHGQSILSIFMWDGTLATPKLGALTFHLVERIPSTVPDSIHNKWSAIVGDGLLSSICCEKRVNVPDIHVVFVVNDVGDANWIPIAIEDSPYLVLDSKPDATGRLDPNKVSALYDAHKLRIGHSQ